MRHRILVAFGAALLVVSMAIALAPQAGAGSEGRAGRSHAFDAKTYLRLHGYLPIHGVRTLERAKAHAAAVVAARHGSVSTHAPSGVGEPAKRPVVVNDWLGLNDPAVSPSDSNGAVGPNSYIEIVNQYIAVYERDGTRILSAPLSSLTGHGGATDPLILWDPHTQRFYYNVLNVNNAKMDWGFSKDSNPRSVPSAFCNYETDFGFPFNSIPDYPKLGQSKKFLMIGINWYPTPLNDHATEGDLLWIDKPQGKGAITKCPKASDIKSGTIHDLRNADGTQAFTPVPAIQTDPSNDGYVVAMADIECPPFCGTATTLTEWKFTPDPGDPTVPKLTSPRTFPVGSYTNPPNAPQKGTDYLLSTLDGRLTHAVSGYDTRFKKVAIWISHTVLGGAGSQVNWYEIRPGGTPKLYQKGVVSDPDLYVFNGGVSNDRTVDKKGNAAHGNAMVLGFNTSSSNTYPAIQMVSKVGANPQSGFVLVEQATTFHGDFSCTQNEAHVCRWGDYSGATPDPAAGVKGLHGEVWLSVQLTAGTAWNTWNFEAKP